MRPEVVSRPVRQKPMRAALRRDRRRQHANDHGEDVDQQDADQERRQRNADQRYGEEDLRQPAVAVDAGVDAHRDAERDGEQGGREGKLEGGWRALGDDGRDRLLHLIGDAEFEARRVGHEAAELDDDRVVEAQLQPQPLPVLQRGVLPHHLVDGVADEAEQHEGDSATVTMTKAASSSRRMAKASMSEAVAGCWAAIGPNRPSPRTCALFHRRPVEQDLVVGALHHL